MAVKAAAAPLPRAICELEICEGLGAGTGGSPNQRNPNTLNSGFCALPAPVASTSIKGIVRHEWGSSCRIAASPTGKSGRIAGHRSVRGGRHPSESEKQWAEKTLAPTLEKAPEKPIGAATGINLDEHGHARYTTIPACRFAASTRPPIFLPTGSTKTT